MGGGSRRLIPSRGDEADPSRLARAARRLRPALPAVVIAALLAVLPFSTCILRLVLGIPCPACGLTRAALAAARLDLAGATHWHPLSLPLLAATGVMVVLALVAGEPLWQRAVRWVPGAAGVGLVVVWVLRFAGLFGGPVP